MSHLDDDPTEAAAALGLKVVTPGPRDVFVDIDSEADYLHMHEMLATLKSVEMPIGVALVVPSKSGLPRRHVYLLADRDLSAAERIALQAALGSDRKRELLSLLRTWLHVGRAPTVFFEKPDFVQPGAVPTPTAVDALDEWV